MANFKVGDHMMYTGTGGDDSPQFYPRRGTEGVGVTSMANFEVGDHVMYTGTRGDDSPQFYPRRGTEGVVVLVNCDWQQAVVQWPAGSTSENDCWMVPSAELRPVEMMEAGG